MRRPRPIHWLKAHPRATDSLLAGGLALVALPGHFLVDAADFDPGDAVGAILVLAASLPLAVRRRYTFAALMVMSAAQLALETRHQTGPGWVGVLIGAYTLGAYRSGRELWHASGAFVVSVFAYTALGVAVADAPWEALATTALVFPAAIVFGDSMRRRRDRLEHLAERAERAERERELLAHQRVQIERTRIARELHDVVAHSVSTMVIQAAAARRQLLTNTDHAEAALVNIEQLGRQAMTEMRGILGVLRDDSPGAGSVADADADRGPQPSLSSIDALVAGSSDLPVNLRIEGNDAVVPPGIELSAYRVVQEALTNVRRHAGRVDRVDIRVCRQPHELLIEVEDDGRGASVASVAAHGFGIVGMRERTTAHGGVLRAGPRPGGGWRVRASFPLAPA